MWWCDRGARRRRSVPAWAGAALIVLQLTACGFHLRGSTAAERLSVQGLYIEQGQVSAALAAAVRRAVERAGATLAPERPAARVIVELTSESEDKRVLTVGSNGRVQDYELHYSLGFRVVDDHGKTLLEPQRVVLLRALTFNVNNVLAKGNEESRLFRTMQEEAINQLIRRLVSGLSH